MPQTSCPTGKEMRADLPCADSQALSKLTDELDDTPAAECIMINRALRTLRHSVAHGYHHNLASYLQDMQQLGDLAQSLEISAVERQLPSSAGQWIVMMHFPGGPANKALRSRQMSFFIRWPAAQCDPQVHVLEVPIYDKDNVLLVVFPYHARPKSFDIDSIASQLSCFLGLKENTRYVSTAPLLKTQPWFRADGELIKTVKDRVLSAALRKALAQRTVNTESTVSAFMAGRLAEPDRAPVDFLLWTRQSNEDHKRAKDSIPRQLASLLRSPLLDALLPTDRVWVVVEMCSSSKHALDERRMVAEMPRSRPVHLLTVNPDRMTRRVHEIGAIRQMVEATGGLWLTSGVRIEDKMQVSDWVAVDDALQTKLEQTTAIGEFSTLHTLAAFQLISCNRTSARTADGLLLAPRSGDDSPE